MHFGSWPTLQSRLKGGRILHFHYCTCCKFQSGLGYGTRKVLLVKYYHEARKHGMFLPCCRNRFCFSKTKIVAGNVSLSALYNFWSTAWRGSWRTAAVLEILSELQPYLTPTSSTKKPSLYHWPIKTYCPRLVIFVYTDTGPYWLQRLKNIDFNGTSRQRRMQDCCQIRGKLELITEMPTSGGVKEGDFFKGG